MDDTQRSFLYDLLSTPSPSGYEARGQRVWVEYVREYADEVTTDAYGNAVAVSEGDDDAPAIAFAGHADEIGYIVRYVDDEGFVRISPIGGADRTVSKGQHVTIHGDDPVSGVVGQTAIHLRETGDEEYEDIDEQFVDIGARHRDEALELVEVGDPVTVSSTMQELHGGRIAARGMDNRVGVWAAAEGFRQAVEADADATVYAVSTVQEELGLMGAKMVGFDLRPDAVVAVDVTHAADTPDLPSKKRSPVTLRNGPVIARGSANHPVLVALARRAADETSLHVQLQATGTRTGTDADAFYTSRSGVPTLNVSIPNRYMHTPVEVVDERDLTDTASLLREMALRAHDVESFSVDV